MSASKGNEHGKFILLTKEDLRRAIQQVLRVYLSLLIIVGQLTPVQMSKFTGSYWQPLDINGKKGIKGSISNHTEFPLSLVDSGIVHGAFIKPPEAVEKFQTGVFTLNSGSQDGPILAGVTYSIDVPGNPSFIFTLVSFCYAATAKMTAQF